ncbi:Protein CcmA, bactofilin family [Tenacibaculum sediminilitoris]|uniref:bactofilin family protein n=1 Tax=Tenacibaculum sediminilitoris TaxID=1820334 RepID=UPI0038931371
MFGKENKKTNENRVAERNIIGKNTKITGEIISDGDFRIDGTLEGTIETKGRVVVGSSGFIKGKVECTNADVEGKFSGELFVSNTLTVKSSANINGDVVIGKLSVEPGAAFNATCAMKGAVKELNKNEQKPSEKTA